MEFVRAGLENAKLIKPKIYNDDRGFFLETWRQNNFDCELNDNKPLIFVQENHSSSKQNVLRGLHIQKKNPQGKLVRTIVGEIYDVILDLRPNSPTFGQWKGFYLSEKNAHLLWVPPGFAHGFYTLSERADVCYKCTAYYDPTDECTVIWNDQDLKIHWPISTSVSPIISQKDLQGISFKEAIKHA